MGVMCLWIERLNHRGSPTFGTGGPRELASGVPQPIDEADGPGVIARMIADRRFGEI